VQGAPLVPAVLDQGFEGRYGVVEIARVIEELPGAALTST